MYRLWLGFQPTKDPTELLLPPYRRQI